MKGLYASLWCFIIFSRIYFFNFVVIGITIAIGFLAILISAHGYEVGFDPRCDYHLQRSGIPLLYPHESYCNMYYECHSAGHLVEKECGPGTNFDPYKSICVHEYEAPCKQQF